MPQHGRRGPRMPFLGCFTCFWTWNQKIKHFDSNKNMMRKKMISIRHPVNFMKIHRQEMLFIAPQMCQFSHRMD